MEPEHTALFTPGKPAPVSSDDEPLILVDADDRVVGSETKRVCHDGAGLLHRAFSIFLFRDDGRLILQQRSASKRLWPHYWSNACCSHPRWGEDTTIAAHRRLTQELGIDTELHYIYKFQYHARFEALGSEHELCWVYVGLTRAPLNIHPDEISAVREVTPDTLDQELGRFSERFTPWFLMEWRALRGEHRDVLTRLLDAGLSSARSVELASGISS